ncbi:MAG TPA: leucyl aminopeptidase [Acidimicrobiales bacterium]|nr:leucyl aminopeptidase [Acidimicrobiales bacterium]
MLELSGTLQVPADVAAVGVPVCAVPGVDGDDGRGSFEWPVGTGAASALPAVGALLPDQPDEAWLHRQGFGAGAGTSLALRSASGPPSVVLLGLGVRQDVDLERWRLAAAAFVRSAGEAGTAALLVPGDPPGGDGPLVAAAIAEGAMLGSYRFDSYRSTPRPAHVDRLVVVGPGDWNEGIRRGAATASAAAFARDLVNTPPSDMTPRELAARVLDRLSGVDGTVVEVWDEDRITAERLGGLLAVARGSAEPPRLVRATYEPPSSSGSAQGLPHVVLVGKGITFDSGGLSLKPADGMVTMKTDMTGAAVVLSVVSACAALGVAVKVTAIAPLAENMPGGRAQKPGDVFTARNGATVEVLNTDAEGRLVLADGLSLASELSPDAIVDVATLTGAQLVALGKGYGAVLGNDQPLIESLQRAGDRAGERLWPLPLPDDYRDHIDSEIADMKNVGRPREAGTIAAAMLLARFVDGARWAHLDIAGPARSEESSGYLAKGATAFGVRALLDFLTHYHASAPET